VVVIGTTFTIAWSKRHLSGLAVPVTQDDAEAVAELQVFVQHVYSPGFGPWLRRTMNTPLTIATDLCPLQYGALPPVFPNTSPVT
jgi:hypothetical protein